MQFRRNSGRKALLLIAIGLTLALTSGCGGDEGKEASDVPPATTSSTTTSSTTTSSTTTSSTASKHVLPVSKNPISNSSKAAGLTIANVLVENNSSPATGKAVADHLEIALKNTSAKALGEIGIYYKITDPTKGVSEGYYTKLNGFTIEPGATRVVHFDEAKAKDHFPVNKFSLYYTDENALVVDVTASSPSVKPATFRAKKDAASAEAGVE